jgi:hypothetical protein
MKKGDWVLTHDGEVGRIVDGSTTHGYYYIALPSQSFSSIRSSSSLTVFDPAVSDILTAVNINEEK